ncbi:TPA: YadA-like family protein [Salmonella enterica subsp. enterica serovar Java]
MWSEASGDNSTATGQGAQAKGLNSTATGQGAQANGINSTATGQGAQANGKNSVALGANSKAKNDNEVNIGIWSGDTQTGTRTISGLAAGSNDDDAVNKEQLDSEIVKEDTKAQGYANAAQSAAENTAKGYADTAKGEAIKEANIYTDNSARQTLGSANSYTDRKSTQAENNAVARSNAYTDNRFGELRKNLEHTEKRLNAGIAGVTALSSIPYVEGNKFSYGIGAGTYQNGNAVAAGVQFRVSPSTNVRLNMSWDSAGNNAAGVGIAGGW